jgi:NAD(P)-dependent dehydrogenase (short-subunit alcohol dehydrogenase family)
MSKVWLITGSSRGFGRALSEAVLASGDRLVATARNPAQLSWLVERYGNQVRTVALDVTNELAAARAVQTAIDAFGHLDVLVNNAGYGDVGSVEETSLADFRKLIETNVFGVIIMTKAALPVMREQGAGHIIQFSSIGGRVTFPGLSAYHASKWGIEGFSEALAKEVEPIGIKVTIIEPGGFRTDWAGSSMTISPSRIEYDSTVGATARRMRARNGHQQGDPAKAAAVIVQIANLAEPPLRLLLGTDAAQLAKENDQARTDADKQWLALSLTTDFDLPPLPREVTPQTNRSVNARTL